MNTLLHRWRSTNDWLKAFALAVLFLVVLHALVVRWVVVENTSMYATLRPGDLMAVERWPVWTGLERGDIVVFRDPLKDEVAFWRRPLMVKRIAGMPGDVVEVRAGSLFVNGMEQNAPPDGTRSYLVRLRTDASPARVLDRLGLNGLAVMKGRQVLELPLNEALAGQVEALPEVVSVTPMGLATGSPRHLFPFSQRFAWNGDHYGPLRVPGQGDTLEINAHTLPLYDRLMSVYEGHRLTVNGKELMLDEVPLTRYVVEKDHAFVLGDGLHHSADSRYWGFLPIDHVVGRVRWVVTGSGPDGTRTGPRRIH
jgi:signal peptidase I